MSTIELNVIIFFGSIVMISCSILKKSDGEIIKGNYEIVKVEKINDNKCQLVCIVYDKKNNVPISNATIHINDLNLGGSTKNNGIIEIEIPAGKYIVTAMNVGNTTIETNSIEFKPSTQTEIKFELGTTIIH